MPLILAGDIGRKINLSLLEIQEEIEGISKKNFRILYESSYPMRAFSDLKEVIHIFMKDAPRKKSRFYSPQKACFAVPGPIVNNRMMVLTNEQSFFGTPLQSYEERLHRKESKKWKQLSAQALQNELEIPKVSLINDYESVCYGIDLLSRSEETKEDLYLLKQAEIHREKQHAESRLAVIGVGTGLGEAFMIKQGDTIVKVCATEGGHTDFAPRTDFEFDLSNYLSGYLNNSRISAEKAVSGHGIVEIYNFLRKESSYLSKNSNPKLDRELETYTREKEKVDQSVDPAAEIAKAAIFTKDKLCIDTMEMFMTTFGAEAGNFALKTLPYEGLYITGGIAPRILPLLEESKSFSQAFIRKGRMTDLLKSIPIYVVLNRDVGLLGAAFYAAHLA